VLALWRAVRIAVELGAEAPAARRAAARAARAAIAAVALRPLRVELAADWCAVLGVRIAVPRRDRVATANLTAAGYSALTLDDELAPSALAELVTWLADGCRTAVPKRSGLRLAKDLLPSTTTAAKEGFAYLLLPDARPEFAALGRELADEVEQAAPTRLAELAATALAEEPTSRLRADLLLHAVQRLVAGGALAAAYAVVADCVGNPALPGDAVARLHAALASGE
jgi:hypothetical protein